jgi:hypothetical protein
MVLKQGLSLQNMPTVTELTTNNTARADLSLILEYRSLISYQTNNQSNNIAIGLKFWSGLSTLSNAWSFPGQVAQVPKHCSSSEKDGTASPRNLVRRLRRDQKYHVSDPVR